MSLLATALVSMSLALATPAGAAQDITATSVALNANASCSDPSLDLGLVSGVVDAETGPAAPGPTPAISRRCPPASAISARGRLPRDDHHHGPSGTGSGERRPQARGGHPRPHRPTRPDLRLPGRR
jgi:hypothetical protein